MSPIDSKSVEAHTIDLRGLSHISIESKVVLAAMFEDRFLELLIDEQSKQM